MKRRLKFTPFAKIIFVLIIIAAARYVYVHQEEIQNGKFFNFNDTLNIFKDKTKSENRNFDTIVFNFSKNDSILKIEVEGNTFDILNNKKSLIPDTVIFTVSEEKKIYGKMITQ